MTDEQKPDALAALTASLATAHETNARLNRRVQKAESAVAQGRCAQYEFDRGYKLGLEAGRGSDSYWKRIAQKHGEKNARLTADIERLAKFAHFVEHGNWRLVVQINPPSNIVKAEMLNQYGLAIASGEGADAVEAILGANAALEAMPEKERKEEP